MRRNLPFVVLLFLCLPHSARAGWVVQERIQHATEGSGVVTSLISRSNAKIFAEPGMYTLLDGELLMLVDEAAGIYWMGTFEEYMSTGRATLVRVLESQYGEYMDPGMYDEEEDYTDWGTVDEAMESLTAEEKALLREMGISEEQMRTEMEAMSQGMEIQDRGSETVNGRRTRHFTIMNEGELIEELWILEDPGPTSDIELARIIQIQTLLAPTDQSLAEPTPEYLALFRRGYPVRRVQHLGWGDTVTTEVVKMTEKDLDHTREFSLPRGMKRTSLDAVFSNILAAAMKELPPDATGSGYPDYVQEGWEEGGGGASATDSWGGASEPVPDGPASQPFSSSPGANRTPGSGVTGTSSHSQGNVFQHPEGIYTIQQPSGWNVQCSQATETDINCTFYTGSQDPSVTTMYVALPGLDPSADPMLMAELQKSGINPTSRFMPLGSGSSPEISGRCVDAVGMNNYGQRLSMRCVFVGRGNVGVFLLGMTSGGDVRGLAQVVDDMARSVRVAPANQGAMQSIVGQWSGVSTQKSMTFYDADGYRTGPGGTTSTEHIYVFYPDGSCASNDFTGGSMQSESGYMVGGSGTQGSAHYSVVGNKVFVSDPGSGTCTTLSFIEGGVLQEGTIRYVKQF